MAAATREERAALVIAAAARELLALGDPGRARHLACMALETCAEPANVHSVMAGVLEATGEFAPALLHWRRAAAAAPASPGHRFNLALALLRAGEVEEGLALQEARIGKEGWSSLAAQGSLDGLRHRMPRPGDPLAGRRLLVFTEQGLGDCLWAARWLPALAATGARLTLATRPALRGLLAPLAPFEAVLGPPEDRPDAKINLAALAGGHDGFLPIMSLPWLLGIRSAGQAGVPWLRPEPQRVAAWRMRFGDAVGPARRRVGLVWLANPENLSGAERSVPVEALAPLAAAAGAPLIALQGGAVRAAAVAALPWLIDGLPGGEGPLEDLAAAIAATDLLVTVDTMAMHLAGSMGHPALVLAATSAPGFVLGPAREHCGWYPSLRLVRRQQQEDWADTAARAAAEVRALDEGWPARAMQGPLDP